MGLKWSVEYNTGIDVIDDQHRRILDYINEIADLKHSHDRVKMKEVLDIALVKSAKHPAAKSDTKKPLKASKKKN